MALYADLDAILTNWTDRTDVLALKDVLIGMVEGELTTLRTRQMVKRDSLIVTEEYVDLPPDWLDARQLVNGDQPLDPISDDDLQSRLWREDSILPNENPTHYARVGQQLRFWPVPAASVTLQITYYQALTPLAEGSDNPVSLNAPNVYRFGVLWAAATFLKDADDTALYRGHIDRAIDAYQSRNVDRVGRPLRSDMPTRAP